MDHTILQSRAITCNHMQSHAITCNHMQSQHTILQSHAITVQSQHTILQSQTITCIHSAITMHSAGGRPIVTTSCSESVNILAILLRACTKPKLMHLEGKWSLLPVGNP